MDEPAPPASHEDGACVSYGLQLYTRAWPCPNPKATVVIVHGYGEHCARYDHIAQRLTDAAYEVHGYDHPGHGRSPGRPGFVASFDALADHLGDFLKQVRGSIPDDRPFFIWGHSMGGLVLATYVIRDQPDVSGLVFSSAMVAVGDDVAPMLRKVAGVLAVVTPWLPVLSVDPTTISREPEEVLKYIEDPLVYHGKIGAKTAHAMMKGIDYVQQRFGEITTPFIAFHGTADRLVDCDASRKLHAGAASADKTLRLFEDGYHELQNDLERERFVSELIGWLDARVA